MQQHKKDRDLVKLPSSVGLCPLSQSSMRKNIVAHIFRRVSSRCLPVFSW